MDETIKIVDKVVGLVGVDGALELVLAVMDLNGELAKKQKESPEWWAESRPYYNPCLKLAA